MVKCSLCHNSIAGVKAHGSYSEKSISRLWGDNMCSSCVRKVVTDSVRVKEKVKNIEDVDLLYRAHVQKLL